MPVMRHICLVHPGLGQGGSEARVMLLLEIFQKAMNVTLITCRPFDVERLNAAYHTSVDVNSVNVELVPMPGWLQKARSGDALRGAFLNRHARRLAPQFDICVSAYNLVPFGRSAIQFIADLSWDADLRSALSHRAIGLRGAFRANRWLHQMYVKVCARIDGGGFDVRNHSQDLIVSNSHWTADLLRSRFGLDSGVIYPPVHSMPYNLQTARSGDFVMVGRMEPDKRILEAIELLARVRARGHDFAFHIVGPLENNAYCKKVVALAAQFPDWVRLEGSVVGEAKFQLLAHHSYALHMHQQEAFGIAVAEQIKMGLIPFVAAGCAPAEIVGNPKLCFSDPDHAVEIIDVILRDTLAQQEILAGLAIRGNIFSTVRFASEVRQLFLDKMGLNVT